jgi:putative ABC transport system permease protein
MHSQLETFLVQVRESFSMAIFALRMNKLRSILTLLSMAVGVFSIIAVMTAMGVMVNSIESGLSQLGANTFQIQKYPVMGSDDPRERAKLRNRKNIKYEEGLLVKEKAGLAKAVGLEAWTGGRIIKTLDGQKTNPSIGVAGEDLEGIVTNDWTIEDGRAFTQDELTSSRHVAIIGGGVIKKLFPKVDPIGQAIRIDNDQYEVIGTIQEKGGMLGGNQDEMIVIPLTAFFNQYGRERDVHIMVQTPSRETFEDCVEQVRGILRAARHVDPGAEDDFSIFSNDSVIEQFNQFSKYVKLGLIFISGVALIAAGVGIMNIMMVSVTERTREIGVRKAIGAQKKNILSQFIMEAVVLSQLGGVIGIIIGIIAGNLIALFFKVPPVIPYDWTALGFVTCSVIGIVFGVYPAWKAANLDPIDALRYE